MSTPSNISDLFQANYGVRIEHTLGQSRSSAQVDTATLKSVKDLINLSPVARSTLTQQEIALAVIVPDAKSSVKSAPLSANGPEDSSASALTVKNSSSTNAKTDETVTSIMSDAQSALRDVTSPGGLKAAVANDPNVLTQFLANFSPDDAAAIKSAFADNTLQVQDPSKVPGFVDAVSTSYTSTGQTGSFGQVGFTKGVPNDGMEYRFMDLGVGHLLVSWPKTTT